MDSFIYIYILLFGVFEYFPVSSNFKFLHFQFWFLVLYRSYYLLLFLSLFHHLCLVILDFRPFIIKFLSWVRYTPLRKITIWFIPCRWGNERDFGLYRWGGGKQTSAGELVGGLEFKEGSYKGSSRGLLASQSSISSLMALI